MRVIDAVAGTGVVLIAGQAVSFWAEHYAARDRLPELGGLHLRFPEQGQALWVSRDIDFLGGREEARLCAEELPGELVVQSAHAVFEGAPPSHVGIVVFDDTRGERRKVDFMDDLYGLSAADRAELGERAVPLTREGRTTLVVDPISQLKSRLANATTLGDRKGTPRALRQCQIAIWVAREWVLETLEVEGWSTLRNQLVKARVVPLAKTRLWRWARDKYALDPFECLRPLLIDPRVPQRDRARWLPSLEERYG